MPRDERAPELEPAVTLPWLVRLRWLFLACQVAAVPIGFRGVHTVLAWIAIGSAITVFAASNVLIATVVPGSRWSTARVMGGVLILDTALLTVVLSASGGAMNPFTVFYLVHITLSATVLSARWTTAIAILAVTGFGVLFLVPADPRAMQHDLGTHLQGMWAAFVLAAALIAFFVRRITMAIGAQREEIAALKELSERNARLASLTTLAAGAAHELNSPLATIAVAAYEAKLQLSAQKTAPAVAEDLGLILLEVDRCQEILHKMAARAGKADSAEPITLEAMSDRIREELGEERAARVDLRLEDDRLKLVLPSAQAVQSIAALIKNAIDASGPDDRVVVRIGRDRDRVRIVIEDQGTGISPELLSKVGEPFFTTKQPGAGLGLGVFLARAFVESRGGRLAIESSPGVGTQAVVELPIEAGEEAAA